MTILINYLKKDKAFINNLVIGISRRRTNHCITAWEMSEGDALTKELEKEDDGSRVVLVILSKEAAASDWCQHGLSEELLGDLDERGIVVIPVMIEDCELPKFAQGKPVADFRTDFEVGVDAIVERVSSIDDRPYQVGGYMDWCKLDGRLVVMFPYIVATPSFTYLTYIEIRANEEATRFYEQNAKTGASARLHVFETLNAHLAAMPDTKPLSLDQPEYSDQVTIPGPFPGEIYVVTINIRVFGDVAGRDIPGNVSDLVAKTCEKLANECHRPTYSSSDQDEQDQSDATRH